MATQKFKPVNSPVDVVVEKDGTTLPGAFFSFNEQGRVEQIVSDQTVNQYLKTQAKINYYNNKKDEVPD